MGALDGIGRTGLVMTTDKLMGMLEASPENFRDIAFTADMQISFGEYLTELMQEKSFDSSRLIKEACLSRTYAYQFISGQRVLIFPPWKIWIWKSCHCAAMISATSVRCKTANQLCPEEAIG